MGTTKLELPPWFCVMRRDFTVVIVTYPVIFPSFRDSNECRILLRINTRNATSNQFNSLIKTPTPPLKRRKKSLWKEWTGNLFPPFRRFSFNFLIFDWFSAIKTLDDFVPGRFRASHDFQVWRFVWCFGRSSNPQLALSHPWSQEFTCRLRREWHSSYIFIYYQSKL